MIQVKHSEIPDLKNKYPLFFQEDYAAYEETNGWKVLIFSKTGIYIPVRIKQGTLINQGQYLYPPLKDGKQLSAEEEYDFLNQLIQYCAKTKVCDYILPPPHFSVFSSIPVKSIYTEMGIITLDISKKEEEIFKSFNSNYRNEIRKAASEGLNVFFGNTFFDSFYSLYQLTHSKQNLYFNSKTDLQNLLTCMKDNSLLAVVQKGEDVLGASLILYENNEAYYFQSGLINNCPYPGAGKLLQFEVIKKLKTLGVERYILGGFRLGNISGTKYENIQNYKIRFGGVIIKGYHFTSVINWKYKLYSRLLNFYLRMRGLKENKAGMTFRFS